LGYSSSLISFKIAREDISKAVEIINLILEYLTIMRENTRLYMVYIRQFQRTLRLGFGKDREFLSKGDRV